MLLERIIKLLSFSAFGGAFCRRVSSRTTMHFPLSCRRAALALLFTLPLAAAAAPDTPAQPVQAANTATQVPLAGFFDNSSFAGALLSPSGRYLAARASAPGRRVLLGVVDLQANTLKIVAAYSDADIGHVVWVNDERLAFDVTERDVAPGDTFLGAGLYAVNRDGSNLMQLADRRGQSFVSEATGRAARKLLPWHTFLMQEGAQDSESIYVTSPDLQNQRDGQAPNVKLLLLNTLTGRTTSVRSPGHVDGWMLDHQGKPRLAVGHKADTTFIYYLDPANDEWRTLASYQSYGKGQDAITPLGFGPDGTLYVSARGGKDTLSLYAFDYKTGKIADEPVVATKGYDFNAA
jgi:hypothetical protein